MNISQSLKDKEIDISIVIPVYNSEDNLAELARQVKEGLVRLNYELIFVDDQSLDGSWNAITHLASEDEDIVGINLRKNSGQDNAIFAGLHYAKGKYVVIMDDDLQHSPTDILRLYEEIE
jgi:polyisoprenyl-phosphate glycosyltransferase